MTLQELKYRLTTGQQLWRGQDLKWTSQITTKCYSLNDFNSLNDFKRN